MRLPRNLSDDLLQVQWAAILDPVINNPVNNVNILKNISLFAGVNVINHKLGRKQQGWFLTDVQAPATIYRSEDFNSTTLTLTSDALVVCNIGVF